MDSDHLYEGLYQEIETNGDRDLGAVHATDKIQNAPVAPSAYLPHELVLRKEN